MRICICCFGLFHRPKRRATTYLPNQNIQDNANDNSNNFILKNRRRSFVTKNEPLNKLKKINEVLPNYQTPVAKSRPLKPKEKKSLYDLKDKFRCLFCGGTKCPYEDYKNNPKTPIKGLNCDIIDNEIYASQRPSNILIEEYNLVKKFHQNKIGMIVNLQRPGEHPYCGPNALEPLSGYSYSPSLFTSEGIEVKLAGWKDMDVPDSLYFMLDIIKDIYKKIQIEKKKVLVHCHAGNGRTGVVISCYLIYKSNYEAKEAVEYLRKIRKKCVEKSAQMKYCIKFKEFLNTLRKVFTNEKNDVDYFIKHQCDLEINPVENNLYIPKLFWLSIDILSNLIKNYSKNKIYQALNGTLDVDEEIFQEINNIKEKIDNGNWDTLKRNQNIIVVSEIFYHWLEDSVSYCIRPKQILEIYEDKKLIYQIDNILLGYVSEDTINTIYESLKNYLKKVEIKILNYIANFFVQIYPIEGADDVIEYKRMVEKISVYLLGFNIDLLFNYKLQVEINNKVNTTLSQLNKQSESEEIDPSSGLTLFNCIKAVECTILILEFLKIKISFPMANECKEKIVDTVKKANGELKKQIMTLKAKASLLKSIIVSKESDILNINELDNKESIGTFGKDEPINRKIKLNLFSNVKPNDKIENQINIYSNNNSSLKIEKINRIKSSKFNFQKNNE